MRACFSWFSKAFAAVFCSHVSKLVCYVVVGCRFWEGVGVFGKVSS